MTSPQIYPRSTEILEWDGDFDNLPEPLIDVALHDPYVGKAVDQIRHRDVDPVKALAIAVYGLSKDRRRMADEFYDHLEREPQITEMTLEDDDE